MTKAVPVHLTINKGSVIQQGGREYRITRILDVDKVLAKELGSDQLVLLELGAGATPDNPPIQSWRKHELDLESVTTSEWEEAERRYKAIEPLLNQRAHRMPQDWEDAAKTAGVSKSTIYRWVKDFLNSGVLTELLPRKTQGAPGKSRLKPEVKAVVDDFLQNKFMTFQKPSPAFAVREIRRLCSNAGLSPLPSKNAIYRHIDWLDKEERLKKREGNDAAFQRHAPKLGAIPDADWPLQTVEMDHTELPVMIVDDEHRMPIKRPWITLAIDVFSRCCLGMYLSLDAPSSMSAGMCVSHAILGKEKWLNRLGLVDLKWPHYGVMDSLHMDNAKEFRGDMLRNASREYNIMLKLRPVKTPRYGAHIERLMGTVSEGLKAVKGTTFSGPEEKGEYDAEGNAVMTFAELEKWLALFFIRYHRDIHRGIGTTPETKWREGLVGTKDRPGRGLPPKRSDEEKIRIDFMPFEERTVQDYGVVIDEVQYFSDVLRPWINSLEPGGSKNKRKFLFRRDPRDISVLYFYDPEIKSYFSIPYRDSSLPPVSIWELREAQKRAKEMGMKNYSERAVFELINQQRAIEEESAEKTKKARRAQQKRKQHSKARQQKKEDLPTVAAQAQAQTELPPLPLREDTNEDDFYDDDY
jgi:putative transposase